MMKRYLLPAAPIAAMLLLTGCMDDNYDLSNIDKTTEVKVNGLVIPVNVKDVTLNSIIDLDENGDVQKEIDPATGKEIYVYSYKGDFDSDAITIDPFNVEAPVLTPNDIEVHLNVPAAAAKRAGSDALHYKVKEMETSFDYVITDIDPAVKKVTALSTPKMVFNTSLHFPEAVVSNSEKIHVANLQIRFPEGLAMAAGSPSIGRYDAKTGIVTIADYDLPANGVLALTLTSTKLVVDETISNGSFTYNNAITVLDGGDLLITPKGSATLASDFLLSTDYQLSSFTVTAFSGSVDKPVDGLDINPILLNDLPSFLTGEGTNLVLGNPQLYLSLNNPVSQYNLKAHTGVALTPVRGNEESASIELPNGLTINDDKAPGAIYKYALSPAGADLVPIESYTDAEKLPYPGLGNVLAGNGLPEKLKVDFADPNVYGNNVVDFPLSDDIQGIGGSYNFRAPLALEEGTVIYYSGTKDDWSSEDLDRLYVTEMQVTADVTSELPVGVVLTAQILNDAGKHMGECEGATLPAKADNYPVTFIIKAPQGTEINNIDGIYYHATCAVGPDDPAKGEAISPEQTVVLKNVRAKVTGRYLYEDK